MIEKDIEAGQIWKQARLKTIIEVQKGILLQAKDGKPVAARQIEALLKREIAETSVNIYKLTEAQLMELTQKTRMTINNWRNKEGLTRNIDEKTYSLAVFLKWFEEFTQKKVRVPAPNDRDGLAEVKKQRLQLALEREKGESLDRGSVITGFIVRSQKLLNALSQMTDSLPAILKNQPEVKMKKILEEAVIEVRRELGLGDIDLKLTEAQTEKLKALLDELKPA